jgi:hypothetical protein
MTSSTVEASPPNCGSQHDATHEYLNGDRGGSDDNIKSTEKLDATEKTGLHPLQHY